MTGRHGFFPGMLLALFGGVPILFPHDVFSAFEYSIRETYRNRALASCLLPSNGNTWIATGTGNGRTSGREYTVVLSGGNLYGMTELFPLGFACIFPVKRSKWYVGCGHFGYHLYREFQCLTGFTVSYPPPFVSTVLVEGGLVRYARYGSGSSFAISSEIVFFPGERTGIALSVENLNLPFYPSGAVRRNTRISGGISLRTAGDIHFFLTWVRERYHEDSIRFAFELDLNRYVTFRAGNSTNPENVYGGFGIGKGHHHLDLYWSFHPLLGPSTGITYSFDR
jgi:hypothetical protein